MGAGFFKASYFHDLSKVPFTEEQEAAIRRQIDSAPVLIYSKDYCPHCTRTKQLLERLGVPAEIVEINRRSDGLEVQAILYKITGRKTVPNNFIGGQAIGGNRELQALYKSGELRQLLDKANVSHNIS